MNNCYLFIFSLIGLSCQSQEKKDNVPVVESAFEINIAPSIGQYVTGITEDSHGNLWFGTLEKGIAKFDGSELIYYTRNDGLPTNRVTSLYEDDQGIYWLNTGEGLVKYDGERFINYRIKDNDFYSNVVSSFLIDSKGQKWVGTWGGVYQFDGSEFTFFPLPYPDVQTPINPDTKNWITEIAEDASGNMWFTRDGYGVCRYDGKSFIHYLNTDGLMSNNVTELDLDEDGNIWLGMRNGNQDQLGVSIYQISGGVNQFIDGEVRSFPAIEALSDDDVYEIYCDASGDIWISTTSNGIYRYDGEEFDGYDVPISIMTMTEDAQGNLWLGGAGGVYRINPLGDIQYINTQGPWE